MDSRLRGNDSILHNADYPPRLPFLEGVEER